MRAMDEQIIAQFIANTLLILAMFVLREVDDKFSVTWELYYVTCIKTLCNLLSTGTLLFFSES